MEYIVNQAKQIGVGEADSPEDAIRKALNGEGVVIAVNISANPRPPKPSTTPTVIPTVSPSPTVTHKAKEK
jgi:hypothetical protein